MNADKLAGVLREHVFALWDYLSPLYANDPSKDLEKALNRVLILRNAINEHDAQPEQAAQPVGLPDGWVMVPREPTAEMAQIGRHAAPYRATDVYRAMVLAAPNAPTQPMNVNEWQVLLAKEMRAKAEECPADIPSRFVLYWADFIASRDCSAPQPPAQPSADAEDARTVEDDVRDFGEGYEIDCRRVHPSRVTCYIGTSDGIFRKYITAHNVTSAAGDASNG